MNLNKLEKDLRDFRPTHHEKINTDVLWDRVSAHIPQSKRKNRYLSFFVLALAIVLIAIISSNILSDSKINPVSEQPAISEADFEKSNSQTDAISNKNQIAENIKPSNENKSETIKNFENLKEQNEKSQIEKNVIENNSTTQFNQKKTTQNSKQIVADKKELVKQNDRYSSANTKINAQTFESSYLERQTKSEFETETLKTQTGTINDPVFTADRAASNKVNNNTATTDSKGSNWANKIPDFTNAEATKSTNNSIEAKSELNSRQALSISTLITSLGFLETGASQPSFVPRRINPYVYRDYPKVSLELGGSYLMPTKTMSLTKPEFSSELQSRELAEEILEGWYATAAFRYNVTPNFGINVGVHYGAINERSSKSLIYTETLFLQDTIVGNLVRVDGTVDPIYGDLEIDRTIMKNVNRINSYSFLQMPIELMYTQPLNRMNVELGFGIIQNLSFKQSGYWHPDDQTEYDLTADESGYLKSRLGMGLTGRLGLSYDLTPGIGVYANARYIKHLSGITSSNYGIDQSYSLLGAEIGLRLHLLN